MICHSVPVEMHRLSGTSNLHICCHTIGVVFDSERRADRTAILN